MPSENDAAQRSWSIPREAQPWLWAMVVLAALLRLFRIGQQSFWADEVFTLWVIPGAEDGLSHYFKGALHEVLLLFWSIWGGYADAWTRCLSAAIGLATIPALFVLARRLAGTTVALLSVFLITLSPFHVWYSQETRNYALLILLATFSQICFIRVLDRGSRRDWLLYGLTIFGALLTNFSGAFLPFGQGLYVLARRRDLLRRFLATQVIVLAVLLPWLRNFESRWSPEMMTKAGALRKTNFHPLAIPFSFSVFSVGFTVGPSLDEMNRALSWALVRRYLWYFVPVACLYAWLLWRGILDLRARPPETSRDVDAGERNGGSALVLRGDRAGQLFYLAWIAVPLVLVSLFAMINFKVFNVRYLAVAFPGYLILLARGIAQERGRRRVAALVLIAAACSVPLWNLYCNPRYWKPDARRAAAYVSDHVRGGDAIRVYSISEPFRYYYRKTPSAEALPLNVEAREESLREIIGDLGRFDRLWLVDYRGWYIDPEGEIPKTLAREWRLVEEKDFIGMKVLLYANPQRDPAGR